MKIKTFIAAIITMIIFSSVLAAQPCSIKEETWRIKTYPFSDPDPVPILIDRPEIYPYFKYQQYSSEGEEKPWKVITLENEYIKVFVLPGVGGKVYGAIEKSTNREFLYYNKVLKFRQIAMRGPWTSGGTEFNFGLVGHTPTVATPVDYYYRENDDGSVSCFVGTMDLTSRTRWCVEIRLPKDKAYFETRTSWSNPTPFNQSYYSWSNNAVKAGEDLEYFYPGQYRRGHGYSAPMLSWPVDDRGRNLSFYKNNNFGSHKSHFVMGRYENFFGGYWHDSEFGFGHWALYDDMPGKKMWIWAQSRQGAIWENLLTDTDGQYSEPQAGRLFSQDDHEYFAPYSTDHWREVLFPFKETGGMVKASPFAVLNLEKSTNSLVVRICPLQSFTDTLTVIAGGNIIHREVLTCQPMEVLQKNIPFNGAKENFQINLGRRLTYDSDQSKNDLKRPFSYHEIDESTTEGIYQAAERLEKRRKYDRALKKYLTCLNQDPFHLRAMVRTAEIFCRKGEYQRGLIYASGALQADMYNPDANYVYGIISRKLGDLVNAKETLGWAARSMNYRSNAYCQLAEIYLKEKHYQTALDYIQKSIQFDNISSKPKEILAVLYRKLNREQEAVKILSDILNKDPLNHFARFELYLNQPTAENLARFKSMIKSEIPAEIFLENATVYFNLGLEEEAIRLLESGTQAPGNLYWLAYLYRDRDSGESRTFLEQANQASARLVFPFRCESIPVFTWAIKHSPDQWKPSYYLGLILLSKGRTAEAKQLFDNCREPDFAPFYILQAHLSKDFALAHYLQALRKDKRDWRNWHYLIKYYNQNLNYEKALDLSSKAVAVYEHHIVIRMDYAISLYNNRHYDKCLDLLQNLEVLPYEGGWEAHDLFKRTNIHLALAEIKKKNFEKGIKFLQESETYPEHLGTGKPYDPDYRLQDYLLAICYGQLQDETARNSAENRIVAFTTKNWESDLRHNLFGYLMFKKRGDNDKTTQLEREWQKAPENQTYQWFLAELGKSQADPQRIEKSKANDSRFSIVADVVNFLKAEGYF